MAGALLRWWRGRDACHGAQPSASLPRDALREHAADARRWRELGPRPHLVRGRRDLRAGPLRRRADDGAGVGALPPAVRRAAPLPVGAPAAADGLPPRAA